jgi:uncharacterized protein (TIGR04551 family)
MRRLALFPTFLLAVALFGAPAEAQRPDPDLDDEDLDEDLDEDFEAPRLRAPQMEPPDVRGMSPFDDLDDDEDEDEAEPPPDARPGAAADLLAEAQPEPEKAAPPSADFTVGEWAAPAPVLSLNGFFRVRGHIWDNFMLANAYGVGAGTPGGQQPFGSFAPVGTDWDACAEGDGQNCGGRLRFANMRMRLHPTLALSDNVRVHMTLDVFDNLVLGSTPETEAWVPNGGGLERQIGAGIGRTPGAPIDSLSGTQVPPQAMRNSFQDSIVVRRAWAEVTAKNLGQLRFGRMGAHWGLGLLHNSGDTIDSDWSTDFDRIMAITKVAGFYFMASWDWAGQGWQMRDRGDVRGYSIDGTPRDDLMQWTLSAARRMEPAEQHAALTRGDWVLNGGLYMVIRKQNATSRSGLNPLERPDDPAVDFFRRDMRSYTPDLWGQFLWKGLRIEVEAAFTAGRIGNIGTTDDPEDPTHRLRQFGLALETEYRLLNEKLGLYLYSGLATGDSSVDGLSSREDMLTQAPGSRNITTFEFHPDYRVDLILWREIMHRVAGAWYLKPGVSYDLIRNSFGQLLGARVDAIYSRATAQGQTYGQDPNLGLELDMSIYYRSEDGPAVTDGFFGMAQFGILFPFAGLGPTRGLDGERPFSVSRAWSFRVLLGVQF